MAQQNATQQPSCHTEEEEEEEEGTLWDRFHKHRVPLLVTRSLREIRPLGRATHWAAPIKIKVHHLIQAQHHQGLHALASQIVISRWKSHCASMCRETSNSSPSLTECQTFYILTLSALKFALTASSMQV